LSTEIACRLRDVGWDTSQCIPCAAPSRASGARHTCLSGNGAHQTSNQTSRGPASGQLEEVMWGCRRRVCVTITVASHHVPTPCRCSLLRLLRVILCQDRSQPPSTLAASLAPGALGGGATLCEFSRALDELVYNKEHALVSRNVVRRGTGRVPSSILNNNENKRTNACALRKAHLHTLGTRELDPAGRGVPRCRRATRSLKA
jgi:hypothetical protein